jgi:hypothetical protein
VVEQVEHTGGELNLILSVMLKFLASVMSTSLMAGSIPVLRQPLGKVPLGAVMYCAFGFFTR